MSGSTAADPNDWKQQYEKLAGRKTREAVSAHLHPYVTDEESPDRNAIAVGNAWTRQLFDGSFFISPLSNPARPACSLVFVESSDGNTGAKDPSVLGGGDTDKHLIYEGLSRVAADAILAGAETVRHGTVIFSVWHPELVRLRAALGKPRHPVQAVATMRGLDFERTLMLNVPDISVALITVPACRRLMDDALAARPWITPIVIDEPKDLVSAFEQLQTIGIERISCVGGRRMATQLIDLSLVQDVYLTTSPRPGGEPDTPMYPGPLSGRTAVRKHGTGVEEGVDFEHLIIANR